MRASGSTKFIMKINVSYVNAPVNFRIQKNTQTQNISDAKY